MVGVGSAVSVAEKATGVTFETSSAMQDVKSSVVARAYARHMRRTAFVAVQVSNLQLTRRLLRRGERPPRNDIDLCIDIVTFL